MKIIVITSKSTCQSALECICIVEMVIQRGIWEDDCANEDDNDDEDDDSDPLMTAMLKFETPPAVASLNDVFKSYIEPCFFRDQKKRPSALSMLNALREQFVYDLDDC